MVDNSKNKKSLYYWIFWKLANYNALCIVLYSAF